MSSVIPDPATTDWVPLGGIGIQGGLIPIAEVVLGAAAASIDFTNIPQTYRDLRLVVVGRTDGAAINLLARFNGDASAIYDRMTLQAISTPTGTEGLAQTSAAFGFVSPSTAPAGVVSSSVTDILGYAQTTFHKNWHSQSFYKATNATAGFQYVGVSGGWRSTAAITQITLLPSANNFLAGTRATLYGLAAPGVTYLPQATRVVHGRVNGNGTIASGTGFTVNRTGAGQYTVTFSTPFASVPTVVGQAASGVIQWHSPFFIDNAVVTVNGFSCATATLTGSGSNFGDYAWNFIAIGT